MSTRDNKATERDKDAQFVASYLQEHPEFFRQFPEVLEKLQLPHRTGGAISLVEKQQAVLRERNTELRSRLTALMETSKTNDRLFDKSRLLVLALIKARSLEEVLKALDDSIRNDFAIEYYNLVLLDRQAVGPGLRFESRQAVTDALPLIVSSHRPVCGVLRPKEMHALFGDLGRAVGSAAAIRLADNEIYGILALGSSDPHRYHSAMDTLFLRFIADVLNLILRPRLD